MRTYTLRNTLRLNGSSDFFTLPVIPSSPFSIAFWYREYSHVSNARIIDWQVGGPADGFTLLQTFSGARQRIGFQVSNGAGQTVDIEKEGVVTSRFYHIAITFQTNSAKMYVDGVLVNTDTSCIMSTAATTLTVGRRATGSSNFSKIEIGQFLYYTRVLTSDEITNLYNNYSNSDEVPSSPTVKLLFNGVTTDSSGNGNNPTVTGGTYCTYQTVESKKPNKSYTVNFLPATTSVIQAADTVDLRPDATSVFSWSAWIYPFKLNNNVLPRIIEKGSHYVAIMGDQTVLTVPNQLALEVVGSDNTATEYWGSTKFSPNRWYHIVTTFNDGTCQHYINGQAEVMRILNGPYVSPMKSSSGSTFKIGNSGGLDRNFPGWISDVRVFKNVVLSQAEVSELYASGIVTNGLVASYPINDGTGTNVDETVNGYDGTLSNGTWQSI